MAVFTLAVQIVGGQNETPENNKRNSVPMADTTTKVSTASKVTFSVRVTQATRLASA